MASPDPDMTVDSPSPSARRSSGVAHSMWWVVLGALVVGLLAVAIFDSNDGPETASEREFALTNQFACPVCDGQSIAESDVPIARELRKEIRSRLAQGQTDNQIREYLVGLYGENIDLKPKAGGVTGLVWVLPVFVFVLAVAGLAMAFRRWNSEVAPISTDDDRRLVEHAQSGSPDGTDTVS